MGFLTSLQVIKQYKVGGVAQSKIDGLFFTSIEREAGNVERNVGIIDPTDSQLSSLNCYPSQ